MVLIRPEIDLKESISEFELALFPKALFNSDGDLHDCVGKGKLMSLLDSSLPDQRPDQKEEQCASMQGGALLSLMVGQSFSRWERNFCSSRHRNQASINSTDSGQCCW